jgi:hypothetical protein
MKRTIFTLMATLMAAGTAPTSAQDAVHAGDAPADQLTESGNVVFGSRSLPYLIHRLPISAFPELPAQIAGLLNQRGCVIPQTYEAHRP